jgi:phage terminase small subunit
MSTELMSDHAQKDLLSSAQLLKMASELGFRPAAEHLKLLQKDIDAAAAASAAAAPVAPAKAL